MTCEDGKKADLKWCHDILEYFYLKDGKPACGKNTAKHNPSCKTGQHVVVGKRGDLRCVD